MLLCGGYLENWKDKCLQELPSSGWKIKQQKPVMHSYEWSADTVAEHLYGTSSQQV